MTVSDRSRPQAQSLHAIWATGDLAVPRSAEVACASNEGDRLRFPTTARTFFVAVQGREIVDRAQASVNVP